MRVLTAVLCVLNLPAALLAQSLPAAEAGPSSAPAAPEAEGRRDYSQISLEELLDKAISVAATKTRVDVAQAPVSVAVLTPEDIRRSGALNLGELLRTIPGIDVLESFPNYVSVSARGTSEAFANNMLVLIDGRRLETQLAGVPFLDEAPLRLEDVKRVEVVKGPVGAVYGTNALAGVISITTYSADEVPGTLVSLTGGNRDTLGASLRHAGRLGSGPWAYKLVAGYDYTSTWGSLDAGYALPPAALRKGQVLGQLQRRFADDGQLELEAAYSRGDLASLTIVTNQTQFFAHPHLRASYSRPDFHALLTFNPQSLELRERQPPIQPLVDRWSTALNLSLDRTLRRFEGSTLTLGGNLRHQRSRFTSLGVPRSQVVGSVFVQNEQELVKGRLSLFGAIGVSHHPEIPLQVDGNAAVVATPVEGHTLRVSFGRAHRDPSFLENFIDFQRVIGGRPGLQTPNLGLEPESVEAWEFGYHGRIPAGAGRVQLFAEGFSERLRDLIGIVTTTLAPGTYPEFPTVVVRQQFQNLQSRKGRGFELGGEWARPGVRLAAHYAYQKFENSATGNEILRNVPRNKFSSGLGLVRGALEFDLWLHSVGGNVEEDYLLLNPRLGLNLGSWELSVQAFNALDDRHVEVANDRGILGERVGRSVTFSLRYAPRRPQAATSKGE